MYHNTFIDAYKNVEYSKQLLYFRIIKLFNTCI